MLRESAGAFFLNTTNLDPSQVFVIESVEDEEVGRSREMKSVIRFSDDDGSALICKPTIDRVLQRLFGRDDSNWIGRKLILKLVDTIFNDNPTKSVAVDIVATKAANADWTPPPPTKTPPMTKTLVKVVPDNGDKSVPF